MLIDRPILTDRLRLAPLREDHDVSHYAAWLRDPLVNRFLEVRFSPPDEQGLRDYIAGVNESERDLLLGIFLANGGHIGNIKIGPIESEHRRATVGILIGQRDKWGEGFATEAISGATDYALRHFDVDIVLAGTYDTNLGSIAAFLKAGYVELARIPCYWLCEGRRVAGVMLGKEGSYVADG